MKLYLSIIAACVIIAISSCKKSVDFNRDNVSFTGVGYYPVSTNALVDMATGRTLGTVNFAAGYALKTELQYFSQGPIQEINLYSTVGSTARAKILTIPYAPAYSNLKKLDTLLIPYTVPTGLAAGTSIKLDIEVLNKNALTVVRTATIKTL